MDFMKVLDQTVREIKREVNLKVLKVPEIEQKVLDATNDEAWGPHGTALSEIAHATKKFECQMIMGVLWSRLTDTGPNWRHVYKALTVIEYLVANGSERAVDDILEHTFQISALSSFEYAEPNGKDVGINVRKKVETILALLNDREKIQAVRDKAAANRDKYVGLSSKGISYKSSSASYSSSSYGSGYGSSSKEVDSFKDSYKEGENAKESKWKNDKKDGQNLEAASENEGSKSKKQVPHHARNQDSSSTNPLKISIKSASSSSSKSTNAKSKNEDDDFDDFDPRGSSLAGPTAGRTNQVDLFGESLLGDLMESSPSVPPTASVDNTANHEVDLFADATFQSASHGETKLASHAQGSDLFASQQAVSVAFDATVDLFAAPDPALPSETKSPEQPNTKSFDPFAAIPINNFNNTDPFGTFASHAEPVAMQSSQSSTNSSKNNLDEDSIFGDFTSHNEQTTRESSKSSISNLRTPPTSLASTARKDNFQVKSGVWSDCLTRGLIDLNISAPKKVNLADIGIVGGLEEASAEKEKTLPAAAFIGRGMSSSSGFDWSGFSTAASAGGSKSTSVQHQFGGFK